jgi:enterochelin esterase-like enzyme
MKNITILFLLIITFSCKQNTKVETQENAKIQFSEYTGKLSSGTIKRIDTFPSKFVKPRNVDVWLPENYTEVNKYAVLYMHDGQMLFDATTTWNKQEWKVDEVASKLMKDGTTKDFIVVAIWNISEIRWPDYYPEKTWNFISKEDQDKLLIEGKKTRNDVLFHSDNYLKFITQEVKPFVDANFSVYTNRENTFIAGSSMGGLISMYAMFEYPEIFGGAACISTHWCGGAPRENNPMAKSFFEYMKSKPTYAETQKFYFDYGTETLDVHYPQYAETVDAIFESKGFDETNFKNLKFEGDAHDEVSWANRLDIPLTFLLGK